VIITSFPNNNKQVNNENKEMINSIPTQNSINELNGQLIAYLRVSTKDQCCERQRELILNRYPKIHRFFEDQSTGRNMDREQFQFMNTYARQGDTISVESLSRLSRNSRELRDYLNQLKSGRIKLISIKENINTQDESGVGKLLLDILIALTSFEIDTFKERRDEGIAIAKREKRYKGRQRVKRPENFDFYYSWYKNQVDFEGNLFRLKQLMAVTKVKRSTAIKFLALEKQKEKDLEKKELEKGKGWVKVRSDEDNELNLSNQLITEKKSSFQQFSEELENFN
jgi:DNA invertase Pin-like site-specific DNA recombinase